MVDDDLATGTEGYDAARCVHLPGVLEKVAHQDDVTRFARNRAVVANSRRSVAAVTVSPTAEEILVVDVESRERQHAGHVDGALRTDDNSVRVHDQDSAPGGLELTVNGGGIARDDAVKGKGVRPLVDSGDFAAIDRE